VGPFLPAGMFERPPPACSLAVAAVASAPEMPVRGPSHHSPEYLCSQEWGRLGRRELRLLGSAAATAAADVCCRCCVAAAAATALPAAAGAAVAAAGAAVVAADSDSRMGSAPCTVCCKRVSAGRATQCVNMLQHMQLCFKQANMHNTCSLKPGLCASCVPGDALQPPFRPASPL
jgi:hypothetical protein